MSNKSTAKVTLHWLEKSRSQRILWLLEECKIDYEVKTYKRQANMLADPALKDVHPLGKSPVIGVEAEGLSKPMIIAESGFITEYLVEHFAPRLAPARYRAGREGQVGGETESWIRYRYFLHYVEGTLMPYMVLLLLIGNIRNAPVPFFLKFITNQVAAGIEGFVLPNLESNYRFLESQLASSPDNGQYLCGPNLTGADILMSFPLIAAGKRSGADAEKYPKLVAYTERLEQEAGYKRAVQKIIAKEGSFVASL